VFRAIFPPIARQLLADPERQIPSFEGLDGDSGTRIPCTRRACLTYSLFRDTEGIEAHRSGTSSLFLFHTDSNVGYAIERSERMFYDVGLEIAGRDPSRLHFAFRSMQGGQPRSLPTGFKNVFAYDYSDTSSGNLARLAEYVREKQIHLIVAYDLDVVHPLCRPVHDAGVRAVIAFWGAPISSLMPFWKLTLKRFEVFLSRSKVDGLIFQSQAMADFAIYGRGVPRHMIDVVRSGVDISLYKPARSNYVHDVFGFPTNRRVVVYAGHMERRKGLESLVEAAVELLNRRKRQDVCFLLLGNKGDESREYEQLYAGLGFDQWIRFGGYRSDLPSIFPSCFCGVIPSSGWDSFPRSPVEMAASGLPVIAARLQGLSESVLDRQTGMLFEPGNSRQLADCIETLLDHTELAVEYGRRGRERCERELNRDTNAKRLREVFLRRLSLAK
jgi:glycosyltransferase involved in cell wall biosynthesis